MLIAPTAKAETDSYDKELHFGVSFIISGGIYSLCRGNNLTKTNSYLIAFATTLAIGVAKETFDERLDEKDVLADAGGAILAPLVLLWF